MRTTMTLLLLALLTVAQAGAAAPPASGNWGEGPCGDACWDRRSADQRVCIKLPEGEQYDRCLQRAAQRWDCCEARCRGKKCEGGSVSAAGSPP